MINDNDNDINNLNQKNKKKKEKYSEEALSMERIFESQAVPSWRNQLMVRVFVVSFMVDVKISHLFSTRKCTRSTGNKVVSECHVPRGLCS
ncbi:hypothetical protein TIFTF001_020465 [Ficus carica]|uniref:Uncharacterized protein n=1 Tax=Ficus carica TaxID=3494 RepID=A0AA88DDP4_FICCA|nr:hypothetical protein TIFTF001_020465 [Ficus carica]